MGGIGVLYPWLEADFLFFAKTSKLHTRKPKQRSGFLIRVFESERTAPTKETTRGHYNNLES